MKAIHPFSIAFISLVTACVSTNVDLPRDHPANPAAPVAQVALTRPLVTTTASAEEAAPAGHQHGHDQHGGHEEKGPAPAPGPSTADAAVPLAAASAGPAKKVDKPPAEVWTCPMHPEVAKSGPGKCPICGMNLVKGASGKGSK